MRRLGRTAREIEPEHRRDGASLLLVALAVVVAAAVWWQLPGGVGDTTRTVVNGSVGLLGYLVLTLGLGVAAALAGLVVGDRVWGSGPLADEVVAEEEL